MAWRRTTTPALATSVLISLAWTAPAWAQVDATAPLEALIEESLDPVSGAALARRQAATGDLVAAAATLERVLLNEPDAEEARMMHAGLLCRLDDHASAKVALAGLAGRPVLDAGWPEITAACGAIERPVVGGSAR